MKVLKVLGGILFMPIAFVISLVVWVISFFPTVLGTTIQSYERVVFNKPFKSSDKDISKSIKRAYLSNDINENDKYKGGK